MTCIDDSTKKPIVIGRLNEYNNNMFSLTGHLGDVCRLTSEEYDILREMDGFCTFEEIAKKLGIQISKIYQVYEKYYGKKKVLDLNSWNQIGWCRKCNVHVASEYCSICNSQTEKIVFSPPCDPCICFGEERRFILNTLEDKFSLTLPANAFLLLNTGVRNNMFFWEVAYKGKILLRIIFTSMLENDWTYELLDISEIEGAPLVFDETTISKMLRANQNCQTKKVEESEILIQEYAHLFKSKPLIYFSGGKESLVMLSLFERLRIEANVITVLTGVEFPEDRDFVLSIKSTISNNPLFQYFFFEEDGKRIIDYLNREKYLSAQNPWCRVKFKKELKNKGTELIYNGHDFVACEGSRWYENDFRRRHCKVNFISDYEHQVWIHPIAEWTAFDVWLYILGNKIPINPVYRIGFQRTTCWLCPIVNPYHIKCSKRFYPHLWEKLKDCKMEAFGVDTSRDLPY